MLVKAKIKKVRYIGHGRGVSVASYKRMRGDGFFDVIKGLVSGGVKFLGNLFRSSGAKQLAQKAISSGSQLAKEALKEGAKSIVKDVASDPMKYVDKATELVGKLKENPQQVAQVEGEKFAKQILNIAKEKVIQPTIDQYRGEFEGVKEKPKLDTQNEIKKKQEDIQNNLGNLIAGMGLKQRGKGNQRRISDSKSRVDMVKKSSKPKASGANKIMFKLRGAGLVPL
jgi:hypothetical protein